MAFVSSFAGARLTRSDAGCAVRPKAAPSASRKETVRMMQSGASSYEGARIGPPPDLPSLLLHNRIIYLGMPLVPAVTELIIAELLYLQYENAEKPVNM